MADLFRALAAASLAGFLTAPEWCAFRRSRWVTASSRSWHSRTWAACASPCRRPPSNRPRRRPPFARFDGATSILTIPTLNVGSVNFTGVTLLHVGDLVFTVLGGTPTTAPPRVEAPARWL